MARSSVAAALIALVLLSPEPAFAQGCAMCRRALLSPEGQQMVAAFRGESLEAFLKTRRVPGAR